jgi:urease accessory protein UreE
MRSAHGLGNRHVAENPIQSDLMLCICNGI